MPHDALIVGAGPVGLTLAALLARAGCRPRIIDKRPRRSTHSKALAVFARTLELLDDLELADPVVAAGLRLRGGRFHADGRLLAQLDFASLDSPFPFTVSIPQSETERLLADRCAALGVEVERSVELTDLHALPGADHVDAALTHADGRTERLGVPYVIGCDGAHSAVRKRLPFTFTGVDLRGRFAFADCRADWPLDPDRVHAFFSSHGVLATIPMPDPAGVSHLWRIIVDVPADDQAPEPPPLDWFAGRVVERTGLTASLTDPHWLTTFTVRQRQVDRLRIGRVILAGDAAHAHSPVGGQGMNTGIQDAANLAWKLALVIQGRADPGLLDSYHAERHPISQAVLAGTEAATRFVTLQHPVARSIRNAVVSFAAGFDVVRRRIVHTLAELVIDYRDSPIVDDASPRGTAGPIAGDRALDTPLEGGRLFELTRGPQHTLLIFDDHVPEIAPRIASIREAVARRYAGVIETLVTADRRAFERYAVDSAAVYLIRPDGYIAFRDSPPDADRLLAHLERTWGSSPSPS